MLIPDSMRKCVAFLCYIDSEDNLRYAGTAFFVGTEDTSIGKSYGFTVTARHIIDGIRLKSPDGFVYVRLNANDGTSSKVDLPLDEWQYHPRYPDKTDVSAIAWLPDIGEFDYQAIPIENALPQFFFERGFIGIGDGIFYPGLFQSHMGEQIIQPIMRVGTIALLPDEDELVNLENFGPNQAYLIESRSLGGLSGSPVFVEVEVRRQLGKGIPSEYGHPRMWHWIGLIHGHYDRPALEPDAVVEENQSGKNINSGVAVVIPVDKIVETISNPSIAYD